MSTPTIQISETADRLLRELAEQTGKSTIEILDKALDHFRRKLFFEQLDAGYAALRADSKAWEAELEERKLWESTLMDGLDPDERWSEDGRCLNPPPQEES